jgi:hypothetical protein
MVFPNSSYHNSVNKKQNLWMAHPIKNINTVIIYLNLKKYAHHYFTYPGNAGMLWPLF